MAKPTTRPFPYHLSEQRGNIVGLSHSKSSEPTEKPLCHSFHGIPYALPPLAQFRWTKPRPLPPCYGYGTRVNPGVFTGGAGICPQPGWNGQGPLKPDSWDEDCMQLNVWMPAGTPPEKGWPVLFFIHGGFLQWGTPNGLNYRDLLGDAHFDCVVVCPAYRLGVLGFLGGQAFVDDAPSSSTGPVPAGNWGFWDQRLALEWTWKNVSYFHGDPSNITVAGYSAGAHSAFYQMAHDMLVAKDHIVRRVIMHSNSTGPPPKMVRHAQEQLDTLLSALNIPSTLPRSERLVRLRAVSAEKLITTAAAVPSFPLHEFKAVADGVFVPLDLFARIHDGSFGAVMAQRGVELLMGENSEEHHVYGTYRSPFDPKATLDLDTQSSAADAAALATRLATDYAPSTARTLVESVYCASGALPKATPHCASPSSSWHAAFGAVYADIQVHALQRGFVAALARGGAEKLVRRYRIDWRAACADRLAPKEFGATHVADMAIWLWGMGVRGGLEAAEKDVVRAWLEPIWSWMKGETRFADADPSWTSAVTDVRRLCADGSIDIWEDEDWERGCRVWDVAIEAASGDERARARIARL